jgi:hypothetical protein
MLFGLAIWLIGSGTFLATSIFIYTKEDCDTVTAIGGRVIEFTCHPLGSNTSDGAPANLVALGLAIIGIMMVFFSIRHYIQNK